MPWANLIALESHSWVGLGKVPKHKRCISFSHSAHLEHKVFDDTVEVEAIVEALLDERYEVAWDQNNEFTHTQQHAHIPSKLIIRVLCMLAREGGKAETGTRKSTGGNGHLVAVDFGLKGALVSGEDNNLETRTRGRHRGKYRTNALHCAYSWQPIRKREQWSYTHQYISVDHSTSHQPDFT